MFNPVVAGTVDLSRYTLDTYMRIVTYKTVRWAWGVGGILGARVGAGLGVGAGLMCIRVLMIRPLRT